MMNIEHSDRGCITPFNGHTPRIDPTAFVDISVRLKGGDLPPRLAQPLGMPFHGRGQKAKMLWEE